MKKNILLILLSLFACQSPNLFAMQKLAFSTPQAQEDFNINLVIYNSMPKEETSERLNLVQKLLHYINSIYKYAEKNSPTPGKLLPDAKQVFDRTLAAINMDSKKLHQLKLELEKEQKELVVTQEAIRQVAEAEKKEKAKPQPKIPEPTKQIAPVPTEEEQPEGVPIAPVAPKAPEITPKKVQPKKIEIEKKEKEEIGIPIHNIAILIDTTEPEDPDQFMNLTLSLLLCQQAVPILVLSHTLRNFFLAKKSEQISENDFDFYEVMHNVFYLIIPKKYSNKLNYKFNENDLKNFIMTTINEKNPTHEQIIEANKALNLGFDLLRNYSNLFDSKVISKISLKELKAKVDKNYRMSLVDIDIIKSIFIKEKDNLNGIWNIFLVGHGRFAKDLKLEQMLTKNVAKEIDESGAIIAGLTIREFRELIKFFNNSINTNFLYYDSCYSSGYNAILPYITTLINKKGVYLGLEKKSGTNEPKYKLPNFTIVSNTTTDAVTNFNIVQQVERCYSGSPKLDDPDYNTFFNSLNTKKTTAIATKYNNKELINILKPITRKYIVLRLFYENKIVDDVLKLLNITGLPQVMLPNTGIFIPVIMDESMAVISNVLTKQHILEKKPIKLKNKSIILIYPENILVDIEIDTELLQRRRLEQEETFKEHNLQLKELVQEPALISMLPGISLQKFESIKINYALQDFIESLTNIKELAFNKYYFIKKLILNNINFLNVLIIVEQELKNIYVYYVDQQKNMNLRSIKNLDNKQKVEDLKAGKFYNLNNELLSALINYSSELIFPKANYDEIKKLLTKEEQKELEQLEQRMGKEKSQ